MAEGSIPSEIRKQADAIIRRFNQEVLAGSGYEYHPRFRGRYLYLHRSQPGMAPGPICRLEYRGGIDNWEFAIYKYSDERYAPEEWFIPGMDDVDGTIEGAMRAGLEAYP